jgi:hypothetical protein
MLIGDAEESIVLTLTLPSTSSLSVGEVVLIPTRLPDWKSLDVSWVLAPVHLAMYPLTPVPVILGRAATESMPF